MKNPAHFGWKFDGTRYIAIAIDNPVALDTVISFALYNCKDNIFFLYLWGGHNSFYQIYQTIFVFQQFHLSSCQEPGENFILLEPHNTNTSLKSDTVLITC